MFSGTKGVPICHFCEGELLLKSHWLRIHGFQIIASISWSQPEVFAGKDIVKTNDTCAAQKKAFPGVCHTRTQNNSPYVCCTKTNSAGMTNAGINHSSCKFHTKESQIIIKG